MAKLLKITINLDKVQENHIYTHDNGNRYLTVDARILDEPNQYGKDVEVKISYKDEAGDWQSYFVGNGKVKF